LGAVDKFAVAALEDERLLEVVGILEVVVGRTEDQGLAELGIAAVAS
jgi:hypothetical protein